MPTLSSPASYQPANQPIPTKQSPPTKPSSSISLLQICRTTEEFSQIHSLLIKTAHIREKRAFGRLLLSLASLSQAHAHSYALKLFETVECPRNSFVYNAVIRSCCRRGNLRTALLLYAQMVREESVLPDEFTFTFVFNACSKLGAVFEGMQAHARMVKDPVGVSTQSQNALMDFYVKIGEAGRSVHQVFFGISYPDVVSWNCLLDGYVKSGELDRAQKVFDEMPHRDRFSWTSLLVGYSSAGLLNEARHLFDEMPERSMVSWSAMIKGNVRFGYYNQALDLFKEMQASDVKIDRITLTTLLSACANLGALDQGRWIHAFINKNKIEVDAHLSTALVDMYGKCGKIEVALEVFQGSADKKVFLWNAVLGGLAMHSRGKEAIQLFKEMVKSGTKPNEITFICLLAACSHSGLVSEGLQIFQSMVSDHNVAPTIEHYGCMVDLLGRAGLLNDARRLIETMPMEADGNVRRALLSACRLHKDVEMGEHIGRILTESEPNNDGNYVLLSNVYASGKRWEDVTKLRRKMKERGVKKMPGCSSIELNGVFHIFVSGDRVLDELAL